MLTRHNLHCPLQHFGGKPIIHPLCVHIRLGKHHRTQAIDGDGVQPSEEGGEGVSQEGAAASAEGEGESVEPKHLGVGGWGGLLGVAGEYMGRGVEVCV